ncbi:IpaD/SipD/SspD family type III secretion system needle tip protein [Erwinia psidii]|uniref:IpaD/SipD/SspD family type III secretion system needle tip protein n=1 Tax=Erwinia psidii TaxID=69224 RepID=A0A3N6SJL2_9GAMM|nr:IpaD/SipD/SspD family type III secretion system needle tip protein [Erwinia psidii]MCX8958704.1 IpaD/SipD/SspD family type III secretion system needle tip protein [Erwinia psidii]MCX8961166.1 IpaD/SipD/SspD family type III secretion system needle tip protein [Erwinia psidii]MCX8966662.1 IpaD/SipD/SspD family type III secretion system needle tip protein [Erwinia psidii]RQM38961.1 IpaD/SipD/SspD family type III secretion system needle tip protein [Erwinia psidii]
MTELSNNTNISSSVLITRLFATKQAADNDMTTKMDTYTAITDSQSAEADPVALRLALNCLLPDESDQYTLAATAQKIAQLEAYLVDNQLDKSEYAGDKLSVAMQKTEQVYKSSSAATEDDIVTLINKQQQLVKISSDATDEIKIELRNQSLRIESTLVQAASVLTEESGNSHKDLTDGISDLIDNVKENYFDKYSDLMKHYTELYQLYNETVLATAAKVVTSGKDGNSVTFNATQMKEAYDQFEKQVASLEEKLGSVSGWGYMSDSEKEATRTIMAPAFDVSDNGTITFNLSEYNSSPNYPTGASDSSWEADIATTTYQSWLASFNAVGTSLQSYMQTFAQRYSQSVSTFNNLTSLLINNISVLNEYPKEVFKNLT